MTSAEGKTTPSLTQEVSDPAINHQKIPQFLKLQGLE
jgi:hypothetical protein